jgi:UDP-N-acetylmuramyl pentapeptide phosphotransferase/UDP-N-acetylglucosamine-1-phosphate transferase
MAPLHHDLQLRGWSEARISLALPALNLIGGALAVALTTTGSVAP